jgi:hypothetical protein
VTGAPTQVSSDAWGDNIPGNGVGWPPDGGSHWYCYGTGFDTDLEYNADWAMEQSLESQTDAVSQYRATCNFWVDVTFLDAALNPGVLGTTSCEDWDPVRYECGASDVRLDPAQINVGVNDDYHQSMIACHEVGHSVGLAHANNDCMGGQEPDPNDATDYHYSAHHKDHVDGHF